MSHQTVADFVNRVETDESLRTRLTDLSNQGNWVSSTLAVAQELGYEFSGEELQSYVEERYSDDLTDEMLDQIAGGTSNNPHGW